MGRVYLRRGQLVPSLALILASRVLTTFPLLCICTTLGSRQESPRISIRTRHWSVERLRLSCFPRSDANARPLSLTRRRSSRLSRGLISPALIARTNSLSSILSYDWGTYDLIFNTTISLLRAVFYQDQSKRHEVGLVRPATVLTSC